MGKAKDLTNFQVGRLTVLYKTDKRQNGSIVWHCKCKCGNEIDISAGQLTRKNRPTRSCGCLHKESAAEQGRKSALDLTGQRFGRLIAIEPTEERKNTFVVWKCKCDCGNITHVISSNLIRNLTKSCGCLKSKGEFAITSLLTKQNITFIKEKTFPNLISNTNVLLRFDFYINNQFLIEYDGIQHFDAHFFEGTIEDFNLRKEYDKRKNKYCLENNIPLYRIPYYDIDKIHTYKDLIQEKYLVKEINHYHLDEPTK